MIFILFFLQNISDLDICVREHNLYGKGFMKSCKVGVNQSLRSQKYL